MELRKVRLGEIIDEYISGDWGCDVTSEEAINGVFCIRGADMVPIANSDFTNIPLRYISNRSKNKRLLKAGDLVIEKSGGSPTQSTGRMVIVSEELIKEKKHVVCSNFCTAIRLKAGWNPLYVYYYWTLAYNSGVFFNFEGKTSGLRNLNLDLALSSIEIKQATPDEQNKLVGLLSDIDRKIALNRRMNATLEAMARQLYDYWFLQFDFPDAHGKPYKSSGGEMTWNDKLKRDIPEGWEVKSIDEIETNIVTGKTPSCADTENFNGDIPFVTIDDIRGNLFVFNSQRTLSKKGADSQKNKYLPIGSLCVSCIGTVGVMGFMAKLSQTNQQINSIIFENECNKEFLYFSLIKYFENAKAKTGNVFANMSKEEFASIKVVYPPKQSLLPYHDKAASLLRYVKNNIREITSLTRLRTTLLPLLMNGQVGVRRAVARNGELEPPSVPPCRGKINEQ